MKKTFLFILVAILSLNSLAQTKLDTYSVYDVDHNSEVNVVDATSVVNNYVTNSTEDSPQVVSAEQLNAILTSISTQLAEQSALTTKVQEFDTRLNTLEAMLKAICAKLGVDPDETNTPTTDETIYSYVGYADDWSKVLGADKFKCKSPAGTWDETNTPYEEAPLYGFWVCTPEEVIVMQYGGTVTTPGYPEQHEYKGTTYNVYLCGITEHPRLNYEIKIK